MVGKPCKGTINGLEVTNALAKSGNIFLNVVHALLKDILLTLLICINSIVSDRVSSRIILVEEFNKCNLCKCKWQYGMTRLVV